MKTHPNDPSDPSDPILSQFDKPLTRNSSETSEKKINLSRKSNFPFQYIHNPKF